MVIPPSQTKTIVCRLLEYFLLIWTFTFVFLFLQAGTYLRQLCPNLSLPLLYSLFWGAIVISVGDCLLGCVYRCDVHFGICHGSFLTLAFVVVQSNKNTNNCVVGSTAVRAVPATLCLCDVCPYEYGFLHVEIHFIICLSAANLHRMCWKKMNLQFNIPVPHMPQYFPYNFYPTYNIT